MPELHTIALTAVSPSGITLRLELTYELLHDGKEWEIEYRALTSISDAGTRSRLPTMQPRWLDETLWNAALDDAVARSMSRAEDAHDATAKESALCP
jgi:hypothetical protein